jgi:hypothetical protein
VIKVIYHELPEPQEIGGYEGKPICLFGNYEARFSDGIRIWMPHTGMPGTVGAMRLRDDEAADLARSARRGHEKDRKAREVIKKRMTIEEYLDQKYPEIKELEGRVVDSVVVFEEDWIGVDRLDIHTKDGEQYIVEAMHGHDSASLRFTRVT